MKFFRNITIIIYCNNNIYFRRIFMKYLFCNIETIIF
ncbi:unknown [Alistipes sp. CAG:29]|nr:unknown [Alistipes sp. CAG:29]